MKPTPRPWEIGVYGPTEIYGGRNRIAGMKGDSEVREANAAHIVKCVNMHEELVATIKAMMPWFCPNTKAKDFDELASPTKVIELLAKAEAE